MSSRSIRQASVLRRSSLALALAMGMGLTGSAFAQATTGSLFGSAEAGDTVQITSGSGVTRTATVGQNGRYGFSNLPLGTYKVSLMRGGATVDSRDNVELRVNAGTDVSFNTGAAASAANASNLEGVTVAAPPRRRSTCRRSTRAPLSPRPSSSSCRSAVPPKRSRCWLRASRR